MNLSKNELLKMAINSKPKKEILEKKSKNELIEYVFGVKVNECSMKKINQSEKHLEKCSSIPIDFREKHLEKFSSIPFDFRNSSYIPPLQQLSSPQYNLPYASPSNDFQKFLPTIMSSIETIKQWNEQEKPNALKLLEDGKNIVSEWINIQRPFFENKLEIVEKIWNNWERVDKPNMEKLLSEIRDTRSVFQNVDMTLVNNVNQKVTDYLQVQKPNIESKYNEISTQLRQFAQVTEQVRNENIKLLQLLGPIEQLRSLFQNVTSFEEFKKNFEKQIQDLKINYEQQLSLSFGNELTQIGEVSLQLSQTEQTISTLESDIIFLKSVFDKLKQESNDSLNEQNLQFKNNLQILDRKISEVAESVLQRDSTFEQARQQWTEAFQNFLSEQRIRELSYDQQSEEFKNRIQQLQNENRAQNQQNLEAITSQNKRNLEAITANVVTENRVNTTTADNEFFQNMIREFRQQWTEAFQNFLTEQRKRELSYDQQSLQFENRIEQLQIENKRNLEAITANVVTENRVNTTTADNEFFQNMIREFRQQWTEAFQNFLTEQRELQNDSENKIRNLTQMQVSKFRQLERNIETIREDLPIALPYKSPLAIESTPVKNLENAIQESNTQISIVSDTVSELRSDNRKMNVSLTQISKDVDSMQRTNVNLIEAAVNRKLIDDQEFNREQIKSVVQQELNKSLPIKNAASTNINENVKQEILKQKDLIRQIVIQVVTSEKKNVLSQLSKSPVNFRIQQRFDKLREENSRLQNIITSISSRLESVSSRLTKIEEPPGKKRKIPAIVPQRPSVIVPQRQSVIVPKLPAQF